MATEEQHKALQLLTAYEGGERATCEQFGRVLVCDIDGKRFQIDPDATFIRGPGGTVTDLAELEHRLTHPEDFQADPPDDEYEPEFTGSLYRADDDRWGEGTWDYGSGRDHAAQKRWERDGAL